MNITNPLVLPAGRYYIGDLPLLKPSHGMPEVRQKAMEKLARETAPQLSYGVLGSHMYAALHIKLNGSLPDQVVLSNTGREIGFMRQRANEARTAGTLAAINFESLGPSAHTLPTDMPAMIVRFDGFTPVTFDGTGLKFEGLTIIAGYPVTSARRRVQ